MKKTIGPVLLSGLLIGPILGSGIILLPPLIFQTAGDKAIYAWLLILAIGFMFALLFAKLSVDFPNEKGIAHTADISFGPLASKLSAAFFVSATFMGPVAVLMTASAYIHQLFPSHPAYFYAFFLLPICVIISMNNIRFISKISFIFASLAVVVLLSGSIATLLRVHQTAAVHQPFHATSFGYAILLLFWALVGWEMIGNFSTEVKQPKRNIPLAVILSSVVVILVSVLAALAVQRTNSNGSTIIHILTPLYGHWAKPLISVITVILCLSTYLTVIGSVTRLVASSTKEIKGLSILSYRNKQHMPVVAIFVLSCVHILVLVLVSFHLLDVQKMVAVANAFFLCNACFGIAAAFKLIQHIGYKIMATIVFLCFIVILAFSSLWVIGCIGAIIVVFTLIHFMQKKTSFSQI